MRPYAPQGVLGYSADRMAQTWKVTEMFSVLQPIFFTTLKLFTICMEKPDRQRFVQIARKNNDE